MLDGADVAADPRVTATRFREVRWLAEVGSTQEEVVRAARSGTGEGLVVGAEHQRAGRGRMGRRWEAPPASSLLLSVLLAPLGGAASAHLPTVAIALSVVDAAREVAGVDAGVKWPNDVVVAERKVAGVLAESVVDPAATVVGLGVNVNWVGRLPAELAATATSLDAEAGGPVDRRELLVALLVSLERWWRAAGDEPERVVAAWRERLTTLGRRVRVELPSGVVEGTAADVTVAGHLVVDTGDRRLEVAAGDVVHLRPA